MGATVIPYDPLPPGLFVWMDLEYTTTDVDTARILEVAAIITNCQLEQIGEPFSLACKPDDLSKHSMPESVVDMHTRNGLLNDVSASTYSEAALEKQALNWLKQTANDAVLIHCGYYLQCDRARSSQSACPRCTSVWDLGNLTCAASRKWPMLGRAKVDIDEPTATIIAHLAM